tara:strand:- start:70 stop:744 length:675 start_codon:yes stop_codon:yes gene_type:complete
MDLSFRLHTPNKFKSIDIDKNELFIKGTQSNNKTLIVSFSGFRTLKNVQFEFVNSLNRLYPDCDKLFYLDKTSQFYIHGIPPITKSVEETIQYISDKIKIYEKVCFIGASAGGYASILYGSLLNVHHVIAFVPQTNLDIREEIFNDDNIKYINLKEYINNKTKYKLIGDKNATDINDIHGIEQCNNIKDFHNVEIIYKEKVNMKEIRDSGELKELILEFVNSPL